MKRKLPGSRRAARCRHAQSWTGDSRRSRSSQTSPPNTLEAELPCHRKWLFASLCSPDKQSFCRMKSLNINNLDAFDRIVCGPLPTGVPGMTHFTRRKPVCRSRLLQRGFAAMEKDHTGPSRLRVNKECLCYQILPVRSAASGPRARSPVGRRCSPVILFSPPNRACTLKGGYLFSSWHGEPARAHLSGGPSAAERSTWRTRATSSTGSTGSTGQSR